MAAIKGGPDLFGRFIYPYHGVGILKPRWGYPDGLCQRFGHIGIMISRGEPLSNRHPLLISVLNLCHLVEFLLEDREFVGPDPDCVGC